MSQGPTFSEPPAEGNPPARGGDPPSNLVWAILVTIFCCLPFGIVAIVYAARVDGLARAGDLAGARDASRKAQNWSIAAAAVGLLIGLGWLVVAIVGAGLGLGM